MPKKRKAKAKAKRWLPRPSAEEAGAATQSEHVEIRLRDEWFRPEVREDLRVNFSGAAPFPHTTLRSLLGEGALRAVRADLEKLNATEKETDLFRFFQTNDLAPRPDSGAKKGKRRRLQGSQATPGPKSIAPSLEAMSKMFATKEFRDLCMEIAQCGELTDRVDLSAQVYTKGAHLLCHDDVIGTRKLSFIYYLTDPSEEWTTAEGGALELYPPSPNAPPGTPATAPTKEILPFSDALVLFTVEPGVSFHAVREVRGERARVSIQGWLHAPSLEQTQGFEKRSLATLQQILSTPKLGGQERAKLPASTPAAELSSEDLKFLAQWIAPAYLDIKQLKLVSQRFEDSSYAVLTHFLREDVAARLSAALDSVDKMDHFAIDSDIPPLPQYSAGEVENWVMVGPPHLRRYLEYRGCDGVEGSAAGGERSAHALLGNGLHELSKKLFSSMPFLRWLHACTQLDPRSEGHTVIRRFRPGLDYTVAAHAENASSEGAELDVTLSFVGGGESGANQWASEEVGGFESYLATDEDEETVEAQEIYRGADNEGPLVNVPATCNTLSLVMRDSQTLRFLKYVGRDAPSSRADISACFEVDAPEGSSSGENGGGAGAGAPSP